MPFHSLLHSWPARGRKTHTLAESTCLQNTRARKAHELANVCALKTHALTKHMRSQSARARKTHALSKRTRSQNARALKAHALSKRTRSQNAHALKMSALATRTHMQNGTREVVDGGCLLQAVGYRWVCIEAVSAHTVAFDRFVQLQERQLAGGRGFPVFKIRILPPHISRTVVFDTLPQLRKRQLACGGGVSRVSHKVLVALVDGIVGQVHEGVLNVGGLCAGAPM
eukprot:355958-Chlamydomonas_euryale.AAC.1